MGCHFDVCSSFWDSTPPTAIADASSSTLVSRPSRNKASTGGEVRAVFIFWNSLSHSSVHLTGVRSVRSPLESSLRCTTFLLKSLMNFRQYPQLPRKLFICFRVLGRGNLIIASIFFSNVL